MFICEWRLADSEMEHKIVDFMRMTQFDISFLKGILIENKILLIVHREEEIVQVKGLYPKINILKNSHHPEH